MALLAKLQEQYDRNAAKALKYSQSARATERRQLTEKLGFDPKAKIDMPGFTLSKMNAKLTEANKSMRLSESVTESQLYMMTTYLVNDSAHIGYETVPVVYRDVARITEAKTNEVSFVVLQGGDVPHPANDTEEFTEAKASGYLVRARMYRYGKVVSYSNLLAEDDQTGELKDWADYQGQLMAYAEEQAWIKALFAAYVPGNVRSAGPNGGIIPPMCIAGAAPANYGGPVLTPGPPSQASLEGLYEAVPYVTDVSNNLSLVKVNTILCAEGADEIAFEKLLQSLYNPSGAATVPGAIGGAFMKNVMEGRLAIKATRFVQYARAPLSGVGMPWGIGQAGRMGTFVNRTPLSTVTEASNAGKSFDTDTTRIRISRRFGATVDTPEFFLAGN